MSNESVDLFGHIHRYETCIVILRSCVYKPSDIFFVFFSVTFHPSSVSWDQIFEKTRSEDVV